MTNIQHKEPAQTAHEAKPELFFDRSWKLADIERVK
jgi:hypothetical protein